MVWIFFCVDMDIMYTNNISQYMARKVLVQLNGARSIVGVLRGYDVFLNVVLDDAIEMAKSGGKFRLGDQTVIRGNSIMSLEALEPLF